MKKKKDKKLMNENVYYRKKIGAMVKRIKRADILKYITIIIEDILKDIGGKP